MSFIVRPDGRSFSQIAQDEQQKRAQQAATGPQIRIPAIAIPAPLRRDLDVNPHLIPTFYQSVGKAITLSLQHPQTKPRILTDEVLRERAETCYGVLILLRRDLKWPLRKCFDVLPNQLVNAIVRGTRPEDEATQTTGDTAWTRGAAPKTVTMNKRAAQSTEDEEFQAPAHEEPDDADE